MHCRTFSGNVALAGIVPLFFLGTGTAIAEELTADTSSVAESDSEIEELIVHGKRRGAVVSTLERSELRLLPGAFGDPFRVVETLPGVTPLISGLPFFFMRGAPPGNAGYFFDGVRVPFLYHLGLGPSVVQPALVRGVDIYSGGYPARFGRFAGGIISADATPPGSELHGEATLRIYDIGGWVEVPFADKQGSVMIGGRYSYTAAILSLVVPELSLDYRDVQARITYALTPRDVFSVFAFSSYDLMLEETNQVKEVLFGGEFYRADLRYDRLFDSGSLRTAITFGYDRGSISELAGEQRYVADHSVAVRAELTSELDRRVRLRAGADARLDQYRSQPPKYGDPDNPNTRQFSDLFPTRRDLAAGAWIELDWEPILGVDIEPGLRADVYRLGSSTYLGADPRIAATIAVHDQVRAIGSFGLAHQPPSFVLPIPGLTPADDGKGLQRSVQGSLGVEVDLDEDTTARATVFADAFYGLNDALGTTFGEDAPDFIERSDGAATGLEIYLKRRLTSRLGGFVSYTLSRSTRSIDGKNVLSAFDRTHVASTAVSYDWGANWRSGARVVFYTGTPNVSEQEGDSARTRLKPFFRLDLRVEKRWTLNETGWISLVLEVLNATASKESVGTDEDPIGPIIVPNLGVEAGF